MVAWVVIIPWLCCPILLRWLSDSQSFKLHTWTTGTCRPAKAHVCKCAMRYPFFFESIAVVAFNWQGVVFVCNGFVLLLEGLTRFTLPLKMLDDLIWACRLWHTKMCCCPICCTIIKVANVNCFMLEMFMNLCFSSGMRTKNWHSSYMAPPTDQHLQETSTSSSTRVETKKGNQWKDRFIIGTWFYSLLLL